MEMDAPQLPNGNSIAAAPPSKFGKLAESLKLEHQLLRVPFEHYKKTIRSNHRTVEKEVSAVISGVSDAADSDLSRDDAVHQLNSLVSRLQGLKRKVYFSCLCRIKIPWYAFSFHFFFLSFAFPHKSSDLQASLNLVSVSEKF